MVIRTARMKYLFQFFNVNDLANVWTMLVTFSMAFMIGPYFVHFCFRLKRNQNKNKQKIKIGNTVVNTSLLLACLLELK